MSDQRERENRQDHGRAYAEAAKRARDAQREDFRRPNWMFERLTGKPGSNSPIWRL